MYPRSLVLQNEIHVLFRFNAESVTSIEIIYLSCPKYYPRTLEEMNTSLSSKQSK